MWGGLAIFWCGLTVVQAMGGHPWIAGLFALIATINGANVGQNASYYVEQKTKELMAEQDKVFEQLRQRLLEMADEDTKVS